MMKFSDAFFRCLDAAPHKNVGVASSDCGNNDNDDNDSRNVSSLTPRNHCPPHHRRARHGVLSYMAVMVSIILYSAIIGERGSFFAFAQTQCTDNSNYYPNVKDNYVSPSCTAANVCTIDYSSGTSQFTSACSSVGGNLYTTNTYFTCDGTTGNIVNQHYCVVATCSASYLNSIVPTYFAALDEGVLTGYGYTNCVTTVTGQLTILSSSGAKLNLETTKSLTIIVTGLLFIGTWVLTMMM